ncbi:MAG TPA: hypothetical protein VII51_06885 [Gaiellaceae bacterium]
MFLLEHCCEHGNVEQAVDALVELATTDKGRHREIAGRDRPYAAGTYMGHWKQIALETRGSALAEGKAKVAARKTIKAAELRQRVSP